jgi:tRNA threonylcarbamoyladenosine biosynthesis protein TsaE
MQSLTFNSHNPEQTQLLGSYLGKLAQKADVLLLTGELGTGKTCLVQGLARGLDIVEYAFSPSFVILRQYHGRLPLYHIDLYRLDSLDEIAGLGLKDYFYGDGVCVIEWAEKAQQLLPPDSLLISLEYVGASRTGRSIQLKPQGQRHNELLKRLKEEVFLPRNARADQGNA